uniref:Uncharacterized protein n=2 Tax=Avena sativa TaxID=4498 RepID=A0ACD5ZWE8_AVESA
MRRDGLPLIGGGSGGWARGGGGAVSSERARRCGSSDASPPSSAGVHPRRRLLHRFFHAVDWKEPWVIVMISFQVILLLVTIISRRNINFQLILSALTFSGVFLAEKLNTFLGKNWKSFSSQNYFDPQGLFISVMWSGPLLLITILIRVNTLVMLCVLMVRWKRAELKHRAHEARGKQE